MTHWTLAGTPITSRLLLGTAHYPSPQVLADAVQASGTQVLTVGLRLVALLLQQFGERCCRRLQCAAIHRHLGHHVVS